MDSDQFDVASDNVIHKCSATLPKFTRLYLHLSSLNHHHAPNSRHKSTGFLEHEGEILVAIKTLQNKDTVIITAAARVYNIPRIIGVCVLQQCNIDGICGKTSRADQFTC